MTIILVAIFLFNPGYSQTTSINSLSMESYRHGLEKLKISDLNAALLNFEKAISEDPNNWMAYRYKGEAERKQKWYLDAEKSFSSAILLNPKDTLSYMSRADVRRYTLKFVAAIEDYEVAIRLESKKDARMYYGRAVCYLNLGKFQKAVADYSVCVSLFQNVSLSYFERGLAYYYLESYDKALSDFRKCIQLGGGPKHDVYYYKGLASYAFQMLDSSIVDFNNHIKYHENDSRGYIGLGTCYAFKNDSSLSNSLFQKAQVIDINYSELYFRWGEAKMKWKKYAKAEELFHKAFSKGDSSSLLFQNLAEAQYNLGDTVGAINSFDRAIQINPKNKHAYRGKNLLLIKKFPNQACKAIDKFISILDDSLNISHQYFLRASCDLKLKDTLQALIDLDRGVYAAPKTSISYLHRALVYWEINYKDDFILLDLKRAIDLDGNQWQAYMLRAMLLVNKADFKNACKDYEMAQKLGANYPKNAKNSFCSGKKRKGKLPPVNFEFPDPIVE